MCMNKLLVILPSLEIGGAERLAVAQINWLEARGYPVFLAVLSDKVMPSILQQLTLPSSNLLLLATSYSTVSFGALNEAFLNKKRLINFCRQQGITHLLAHLPLAHNWGRMIKQALPVLQLICYHHSLQYAANPLNSISKKAFHWINSRWSKRFDDIHIFISAAVQQDISNYLPITKGNILFNAVPDARNGLPESDKAIAASEIREVELLIPGRLHPAKGHLFFLDVFSKLVQTTTHTIHLTIAGGGDLQPVIEGRISALQLGQYCTLTGPLDNNTLLEVISKSHLIIIPSVIEGLGIVAIEALMLGKTVLASDAGGLSEVIKHGENGYLFEVGNQFDCLNKLNAILNHLPDSLIPDDILRKDYMGRFGFEAHMTKLLSILQLD